MSVRRYISAGKTEQRVIRLAFDRNGTISDLAVVHYAVQPPLVVYPEAQRPAMAHYDYGPIEDNQAIEIEVVSILLMCRLDHLNSHCDMVGAPTAADPPTHCSHAQDQRHDGRKCEEPTTH